MKKTLLLLAVCSVFSMSAAAQISQGTFLVGASSNLGFSTTSYGDGDNLNAFVLDLNGGYFVIDNLAVGLSFGYSNYSSGDFSGSTTSVGLFGRYYVQGKIFAGLGFSSIHVEDADALTSIPLEVGYAAFLTDNIAIEPSLNYGIGMGDNSANTFGLNIGFTLYLNRQ